MQRACTQACWHKFAISGILAYLQFLAQVDVVKYNCYGESATYGVPLAQGVKVSKTHPVFSTGVEISQISEATHY